MFMNLQKCKWNNFFYSEYKYELAIKRTEAENLI